MGQGHDHTHAHGTPGGRSFALAILLNLVFVGAEISYGIASKSMSLVADAIHNLSDVLGLLLAWIGVILAARQPTAQRTYGLRKSTILAALANACLLLVAVGGIVWEAVGRFAQPAPVQSETVIIVAALGMAINGVSAALFARGRQHDINIKGAYLHLAADAAVSAGVVVAGLIILNTGWDWVDPLTSVGVSLVVVVGTWRLLRESLDLALDSVPSAIDLDAVRRYLLELPGVRELHDLHIWAMSTTEVALTAHLVTSGPTLAPNFLDSAASGLREAFHIDHATLQLESVPCSSHCALSAPTSSDAAAVLRPPA